MLADPHDPARTGQDRAAADLAFLSRLAGGLAHEIKNPLSTMAINLALLEEDWARGPRAQGGGEPSPREARTLKRLTVLKREVQRLESILQDFLVFVHGGEVNRAPRDLGAVVQEVLDFVEPENERAGIRQRADIQLGLPLVLVDETQIKQALLNLFVNARQAMPTGGELLVRVGRIGNEVEVSVTDTGIGMTPEQAARCFELYWSNKKGGTGLGLSTTQRIIEEHGGSISVVSELGRGSSFRFNLPLAVELTGSPGRAPVSDPQREVQKNKSDGH
jgi:two-component system, NtrC family, sensor histidine kinase HydH